MRLQICGFNAKPEIRFDPLHDLCSEVWAGEQRYRNPPTAGCVSGI